MEPRSYVMCEATEMGEALGMTLLEKRSGRGLSCWQAKVDRSRRSSERDRAIQASKVRGNSDSRIKTQS